MSKYFLRQLPSFLYALPAIAAGLSLGFNVNAQTPAAAYPAKLIKLIAPVAAGGGLDNLARKVADRLSKNFGQSIVVENMGWWGWHYCITIRC